MSTGPQKKCKDCVREDMCKNGVTVNMAQNRNSWKVVNRKADPSKLGISLEEEREEEEEEAEKEEEEEEEEE
ncbi:Protein of unknown function [Gryllus bimaculatus]|nr:Protein of unknown function [Gryllus bimaculatus]